MQSLVELGGAGWVVEGGTSAATAYVAGLYGRANRPTGAAVARAYSHPDAFFDVTDGFPGYCPPLAGYVCTAAVGFDGPTGLGSPNGLAGF